MTTYVLVKGAWHAGWAWRRFTPLLRKHGHEVFTPTLTGLGERAHLAHAVTGLDTHIQDVVAMIEAEELSDIVLLGHSYGGMVVTGVADRLHARIRHLVYLDAFVPEDGKCALDYVIPERAAAMRAAGEAKGVVPPPPAALWGVTDPADVAWTSRHEVPHPFSTFIQPIRIANPQALARLPKTYIYCSQPATGSFDQFARRFRADPAWRVHELKTGHDAMILVPQALADLLLKI